MKAQTLTPEESAGRLANTAFVHLYGTLYASYSTDDFTDAASLVAAISKAADALNHHPDIRLGFGSVDVELTSHDAGGVTERDLTLAQQVDALARTAGAAPKNVRPARYAIAIDTVDADAIRDFWRVGLGYEASEDEDDDEPVLVDPRGNGPVVWFQYMEPPRTQRNRIHLDVYVPTTDAESRVQAVMEAGGTLVTDEFAPDWWVLADVEGNELCVCTADD